MQHSVGSIKYTIGVLFVLCIYTYFIVYDIMQPMMFTGKNIDL